MNILFSSLSGSNKTESLHYLRVLQRMGHNVFRSAIPASKDDPSMDLYVEAGYAPDTTLDGLQHVSGFDPDLFLYIEPGGLIPRGMETAPFPTACILCDTHRDLAPRLKLARFFDHVFLYHHNYMHYFKEHSQEHVHWLPYACDLKLFRPLDVKQQIDVAFIGQLIPGTRRQTILSHLSKRYKMNEQRFYRQEEIPEIYSQSKIVLNLPLADDLNFRTFEAMSCGTMLLTQRISNGQEILFKEGQHFVAFGDEQELYDKVDYYFSSPKERNAIAAAGLAEIQKRHSLEHRITKILDVVCRKPHTGAPIRSMSTSRIYKQYAWLYEYWRMPEAGLKLVREARRANQSYMKLLFPAIRSILRVVFR